MRVFVDSGPFIALLDRSDQHHASAREAMARMGDVRLITSLFVLGEVAGRGVRLVGARPTSDFIRKILSSPLFHVVDVGLQAVEEALEALLKFEDQGLSFVDATNVVLMRAARTRKIFSFDGGFRKAGFDLLP